MSQSLPVLLLQLGEANESIRAQHGGYASWYERAWGSPLHVVDGRKPGEVPDPRGLAAILITGSAESLRKPTPWMDDAADFVRRAIDCGTPTLGACFGHQLIGYALGGKVVRNPRGWEIGSCDVALAEAGAKDPLFAGVASRFRVNLTHEDMICPESLKLVELPHRVLAWNEATPVQALAVSDHVRGVQFHPELPGAVCRAYIRERRPLLVGMDADALLAQTEDCAAGVTIMQNFRRLFVEKGGKASLGQRSSRRT
ncbi:MAG: gamma-glutamyl-gamma-aminobutyrate hydrolase family protein [Deltaproteobacteria bacterium]|nr:gamma-glutamyl-gamma-aminobutyrate hydrolase family protein [Deltaproteobacteria bacterium]